ncbi:MAG: hypothetical protein H0X69_03935 [Gemmatimonadales bacterium]|nr:hypothetical protein [Gemmatimonadales bacterium]
MGKWQEIGRLLRSPTIVPVLHYAASGGGFALANLLLARRLPEREYALFTLVLAMMNLGAPLAAAGLDGVAVRGGLRFDLSLLGRACLAASVVALALGLVSARYGVGLGAVGMIVVSSAAGGAMVVAAAEFQRQHRFALSLALVQSPNYTLLFAAVLVMVMGTEDARLPLLVTTAGFVAAGSVGWLLLLRPPRRMAASSRIPWREALSLAATNASGTILGQLDRLIIPYVLPLPALATYGVLSAVVGSLFRVLQRGVGYALLPRLRAAGTVAERRRLVAGEARVVVAIVLVGSLVIWLATPALERWLLADKYHFSDALVLAALFAGWAKILTAFSRAAVTALADARELTLVNISGWASVALAVGAGVAGARWGLAGVIYGVGLGWLVRGLASLALTYRYLRTAHGPDDR